MLNLPLSEQASHDLTQAVVYYQAHRSDTVAYRLIHGQTQQILYALPAFLHLLSEEDCCEFLFSCYEMIDYYLESYRIGRLSYIGYLTQVVRKRSRYFIAQKHTIQHKEHLVAQSEQYHERMAEETMPDMVAEHASYTPFSNILVNAMQDLPALFSSLMEVTRCPTRFEQPPVTALQKELEKPVNRKRFLIMLTLSPDVAGQYLLEDLASILRVEVPLLARYLNTANLMLEQKRTCKQEFEQISNRHFRRLLEIESQMEKEEDKRKRQKLEELRTWTQRVYKAKVEQIKHMEFRLSHSQVGTLLGIPKGTVDSAVHYMSRLLTQCLDE